MKYRTLDLWRAVAALAVVVFHCTNTSVSPEMGWWARALLAGWAGVFIFFPISGYCIFAAVSRRENARVGAFLRRRWFRIAPPYWASMALAVGLAAAALPFNHQTLVEYHVGPAIWLSAITLTQGFTTHAGVVNPVYWSLCYEEQFYLVMALTLVVSARRRLDLLLAVTVAAVLYVTGAWPASLTVTGLFLKYWTAFASGLAAFAWLNLPGSRRWAAAVLVLTGIAAVKTADPGLLVSLAAAIVFIALKPFDEALASTRVGAVLIRVGLFSYSLYLIHVPLGGRVVNLFRRFDTIWLLPSLLGIIASVVGGWAFYRLVERHFLNSVRVPTETTHRIDARDAPARSAV